jgi:hypothetical protein
MICRGTAAPADRRMGYPVCYLHNVLERVITESPAAA